MLFRSNPSAQGSRHRHRVGNNHGRVSLGRSAARKPLLGRQPAHLSRQHRPHLPRPSEPVVAVRRSRENQVRAEHLLRAAIVQPCHEARSWHIWVAGALDRPFVASCCPNAELRATRSTRPIPWRLDRPARVLPRPPTKDGGVGFWSGHAIAPSGYYHTWCRARIAAGCPASIPHDFRRTAIRNMVRAGSPNAWR